MGPCSSRGLVFEIKAIYRKSLQTTLGSNGGMNIRTPSENMARKYLSQRMCLQSLYLHFDANHCVTWLVLMVP
jgi:hypothetical protein